MLAENFTVHELPDPDGRFAGLRLQQTVIRDIGNIAHNTRVNVCGTISFIKSPASAGANSSRSRTDFSLIGSCDCQIDCVLWGPRPAGLVEAASVSIFKALVNKTFRNLSLNESSKLVFSTVPGSLPNGFPCSVEWQD